MTYCSQRLRRDCYDVNVQHTCCATCAASRDTLAPANFQFGDKASWCHPTQLAPWDCYSSADTCCETCPTYHNGQPGKPLALAFTNHDLWWISHKNALALHCRQHLPDTIGAQVNKLLTTGNLWFLASTWPIAMKFLANNPCRKQWGRSVHGRGFRPKSRSYSCVFVDNIKHPIIQSRSWWQSCYRGKDGAYYNFLKMC